MKKTVKHIKPDEDNSSSSVILSEINQIQEEIKTTTKKREVELTAKLKVLSSVSSLSSNIWYTSL